MQYPFAPLLALLLITCLSGCSRNAEESQAALHYPYPFISPGVKFSSLPPAVQRTVRAQAGAASIADITRSTNSGALYYTVWFSSPEILPPLHIARDGSILNPDLTLARGAPSDQFETLSGAETSPENLAQFLPPDVFVALSARAPIAEITSVSRQPWGERSLYVVSFRDPKSHPTLYLTSEGTLLTEIPK